MISQDYLLVELFTNRFGFSTVWMDELFAV